MSSSDAAASSSDANATAMQIDAATEAAPPTPTITEVSSAKCFGGVVKQFKHRSAVLDCDMTFVVFLPAAARVIDVANKERNPQDVPALYWLSGLTCNDQNFITKAGAQRAAAKHDIILVCPDTSPRGCNIPGETDSWDFGAGAGFYVDATEDKWSKHYNMYTYITAELQAIVEENFNVNPERQSIFGHSMGGHGALICALKNPGMYKSVSAFAPICHPTQCPWGTKAFSGYLGADKETWKEWDATLLTESYNGPRMEVLIDQVRCVQMPICRFFIFIH
ncbi:esterase D/formylglutathione hydrolase, variant 1 [Capsaspora owczarzaki ATCC 30864]|uniref:S-formylglutathione hydrolase n=1 Tax=Capsaspora owczarzaki (strain ATCC 30864) TaxID=595528 RepID=A0A0D2UP76_CAPO3|nr:esterase D/formylglutathione hydrolase, variant 1 [Capsaspora owczarzaki ATCC 30864]